MRLRVEGKRPFYHLIQWFLNLANARTSRVLLKSQLPGRRARKVVPAPVLGGASRFTCHLLTRVPQRCVRPSSGQVSELTQGQTGELPSGCLDPEAWTHAKKTPLCNTKLCSCGGRCGEIGIARNNWIFLTNLGTFCSGNWGTTETVGHRWPTTPASM